MYAPGTMKSIGTMGSCMSFEEKALNYLHFIILRYTFAS